VARGSAAGFARHLPCSTSRTSIRFVTGCFFERFLNPERVNPPDIDIDFADDRRADVIEYVRNKYGRESVAQIVTFGTMGAKSVVPRCRAHHGFELTGSAIGLAKMIPTDLR
jgi:DNA polymerase-3 subunit alpha